MQASSIGCDELKALPKDAGWGRRGTAAAKGVLKEADNLIVGAGSTIAAGLLLANPVSAAALGLTLATAYGLGADRYVNPKLLGLSQKFFRDFLGVEIQNFSGIGKRKTSCDFCEG